MKDQSSGHFWGRMQNKKAYFPLTGQIELTYRCNLNCIHCYCKGSEEKDLIRSTLHAARLTLEKRELATEEWKKIIDGVHKEGCLFLCLTGGDPLVREDFLEIYSYAKHKGFIVALFTNGQGFTKEIIDYLAKSPPFSIEITLNGITKDTYESITQTKDSFSHVMETMKILAERKLKLTLKANCLKQNKHEISRIKAFTEKFLGKPSENKYYFKYDPMICPRLNGDKTPCQYRFSFKELVELRKQDPDIWKEYEKGLHSDYPELERDNNFLYRCNSWMSNFFINPYGRLKFCIFSDKYSSDLKTESFKEGFYHRFPQLLKEKFKTDSKCRTCSLRPICYHCPARAHLETGDEEAPVPYYCELAKEIARDRCKYHDTRNMLHAAR